MICLSLLPRKCPTTETEIRYICGDMNNMKLSMLRIGCGDMHLCELADLRAQGKKKIRHFSVVSQKGSPRWRLSYVTGQQQ